jgi:ADP-dependent NAD(P)H-hydrate dehydratase / NAD(P)H-hydrate epimerase
MYSSDPFDLALLTVGEMARADRAAVAGGVPGERLMEAAGRAVAEAVCGRSAVGPTLILCGPGNNGGDGFVAARHLREAGWPVRVALLGERGRLAGDAAGAAARWDGPVEALGPGAFAPEILDGVELVVDALFGAGLSRPLEGVARAAVEALNARGVAVVAVDVPSGLHGDSGAVLGAAARAALTVTFFRRKPGHLLLPGRLFCGEVVVSDIGIPATLLGEIAPKTFANGPALWLAAYHWPSLLDHKYRRGHALVVGGGRMTGAAKLASRAALRAGAGLVTVAGPPGTEPIYLTAAAGLLAESFGDLAAFEAVLERRHKTAYLLGPGNEATAGTRAHVLAALATGRPTVLDADAISCFEGEPSQLFAAIKGPVVMTPHEGEFRRIFDASGDKPARARAAAEKSKAVILLKGADSVIAAPDGRAIINENAPPELATAGSGDVLSGFVLALIAQGMPPFEAAAAAAWLHGEAATEIGPGLIAEDLPDALPAVLRRLRSFVQGSHSSAKILLR